MLDTQYNNKTDNTLERDFLSDPKIQENYTLLQDMGIFQYINSLNVKINDYQDLFSNVVTLFHHTNIDDILDTAVLRFTSRIKLASLIFLWKPFPNKDEITVKGYKDHKLIDMAICIEHIAPFEIFFRQYPKPMITYKDLLTEINNTAAVQSLQTICPELIIPILSPASFYGLILVGGKIGNEGFNSLELTFIQYFMSFVSLAIQNHLNYNHSLQDPKTGIYNYGFFMTRLTEELARMKRNEYVSSIIVIDVDYFKKFNDTYGHVAGDQALKYIAASIKQGVRLEDVPARFGGEEFTVLLPDTDEKSAWGVAERLRYAITQLIVPWETPLIPVTISLGIFTFDNTIDSITEIINRADKALYKSKEQGRNCTTIWEPGFLVMDHH